MTTPIARAFVSIAAAVSLALGIGGCAARQPQLRPDDNWVDARYATITFDNRSQQYVHVYLVTMTRQWLLGRAEPGAKQRFRVPDESFSPDQGFARLVVVADSRITLQALRDPNATTTIAQPTASLTTQSWTFEADNASASVLWGLRPPHR